MKQVQVVIEFWEENLTKEKQIQLEVPSDLEVTEDNLYNYLGNWNWFNPTIIDFWEE